eukprot:CCRYP_006296-RA/>CCRYP_006296-RA protein AED:0.02 eAED:0.02 QI:74/1/1/1/0/0.5/2/257/418
MDQSKRPDRPSRQQSHPNQTPCNLPLSRAARQLLRQEASSILIHYFGNTWNRAGSGGNRIVEDPFDLDELGRKRHKLSYFRVDDGLSDEEWFSLLSFAIDYSQKNNTAASQTTHCPLHPERDVFLPNDRKSFVLARRYLTASSTKKFGGLSLPFSGRVARATLLYNEQHEKDPNFDFSTTTNNVFMYQCGHCEKTFLSIYYLDRHMEKHHPSLSSEEDSVNAVQTSVTICPADNCDPLGGVTACSESFRQISPYYGPGTMLGKEYLLRHSDSLFQSSFHKLLSYWSGRKDSSDTYVSEEEHRQNDAKKQPPKEGDVPQVVGEIRRRSLQRTDAYIKEIRTSPFDEIYQHQYSKSESTQDGIMHKATTESCSDTEMQKLFEKCQDLMVACFGNEVNDRDISSMSGGHETTLVKDLITQI